MLWPRRCRKTASLESIAQYSPHPGLAWSAWAWVIKALGTGFHGSTQASAARQYRPDSVRSIKFDLTHDISLKQLYLVATNSFLMEYLLAIASVAALSIPGVALAQKSIPKADGHNQCPLGYVNTLGTKCVSPVYYEMMPTNGEACPSGWMNVGAGYCRKK